MPSAPKDIARRKAGITGVSEFPDVSEQQVSRVQPDFVALRAIATSRITKTRQPDGEFKSALPSNHHFDDLIKAAAQGATLGQMAEALGFRTGPSESITPFPLRSFAGEFEDLRAASDTWQAIHGRRPRVFLANMGSIAHHTARATYSKNFFEVGGFDVINNNGFADAAAAAAAFVESGARIAVICSSDKLYPEVVPAVTGKLKEAGARTVVLAGNPGNSEAAWREAGVDRFIFIKCDVLATLRDLLSEEGVLEDVS